MDKSFSKHIEKASSIYYCLYTCCLSLLHSSIIGSRNCRDTAGSAEIKGSLQLLIQLSTSRVDFSFDDISSPILVVLSWFALSMFAFATHYLERLQSAAVGSSSDSVLYLPYHLLRNKFCWHLPVFSFDLRHNTRPVDTSCNAARLACYCCRCYRWMESMSVSLSEN